MLTARLLDWFHILRSVHQKEQWKLNGFDLPKLGEVVPHLKMKDAKMPFPSGRNLDVKSFLCHFFTFIPAPITLKLKYFYHLFSYNFCYWSCQALEKQFAVNQYILCSTMCWIKILMVSWMKLSWQTFMRLEQSLA